ncbi:glycosyl hydrolase family 18 protein [Fulvivirgaceae bacterium BMA12]|uniref:chitinase n=1 Tax=Agaribacillus aureus TaxID=3051825 RepID=A0ABT8L8R3_9BACT|nr:glycosyl hydrolase family 18 protein [Fulvivirgaceae bacterium BMA12]
MLKQITVCSVFFLHLKVFAQVKNYAADFPGAPSSEINFGDINEADNATAFTFECWIKLDSWNENSYVFSKALNVQNRIDIQLGPAANKRIYFHVANGGNNYAAVENAPVSIGQWHHIVMAYDGTQSAYNQIDIYIDGVASSKWYMNGNGLLPGSTPATSASVILGANFDGKIDEARLWNIKLSGSDIVSDNTVSSSHPLYNSLIGYWRMDQHTSTSSILDYKANYNGSIATGVNRIVVDDNNDFKYRIVSAYIRPQFYQAGAVDDEYLRNNNDIINLITAPYADGELFFEFPISDGVLSNATHLNTFSGRNGVLDFNGSGSKMNGGKDLMNLANGGVRNFSFEAWVYIDQWVENSCIFRKTLDWQNRIDLQLGPENLKRLYFHVADGGNNYAAVDNSGLTIGAWHHVAVVYRGNQCAYEQAKVYIDGVEKSLWYMNGDGQLPSAGPFIRSDFELGHNFDGKIDEVLVFRVPVSPGNIIDHKNNGVTNSAWPNNQITAYWKFDDPGSPGKDDRSWLNVHNAINNVIAGYEGVEYRPGVYNGDWTEMIKNPTARQNFANNIRNLIDLYGFDGVDLDFEWCYNNTQCWTDYGNTVIAIDNVLHADETFSVTLHPVSYQMPANAHTLLDFISIQSYGPRPSTFGYNKYVSDIQLFLNYGFPKNKLVAGLPFYGVSDPQGLDIAYTGILNAFPTLDPATDQVNMLRNVTIGSGCEPTVVQDSLVTMVFNGKNTVINKTKHAKDQDLAGAMYWDTATDADYTHPLCLLKALNSEMNANIQIPAAGSPSAARVSSFNEEIAGVVSKNKKFLLYPNPSREYFTIQLPSNSVGGLIQVFDLQGKAHFSSKVKEEGRLRIAVQDFLPGLYIVKLSNLNTGKSDSVKLRIE